LLGVLPFRTPEGHFPPGFLFLPKRALLLSFPIPKSQSQLKRSGPRGAVSPLSHLSLFIRRTLAGEGPCARNTVSDPGSLRARFFPLEKHGAYPFFLFGLNFGSTERCFPRSRASPRFLYKSRTDLFPHLLKPGRGTLDSSRMAETSPVPAERFPRPPSGNEKRRTCFQSARIALPGPGRLFNFLLPFYSEDP